MARRGSSAQVGRTGRCRMACLVTLASLLALAAGCGKAAAPRPSHSPAASPAVVQCGSTKTAADVPVNVEVVQGHASCATALAIEASYAKAIRSGLAPGNGGGGPVKVRGWTCQGFATPIVLQTGKASKCVRSGSEILEILPPTSSS